VTESGKGGDGDDERRDSGGSHNYGSTRGRSRGATHAGQGAGIPHRMPDAGRQ